MFLLDEPSSGLNEGETTRIGELLIELAAADCAVVLVEHDVELVMRVCNEITVLDSGKVIAHGPPAAIRSDRSVQLAYLGVEADLEDPAQLPARAASRRFPIEEPPEQDRCGTREGGSRLPVLELEGVQAGYGPIEVLHGVDLAVATGTVLALLGPNGAGKSTTIRAVCGLVPLRGGQIRVEGDEVGGRPPEWLVRRGVCTIPEGRSIFPNLTVWENIWLWTHQKSLSFDEVVSHTFEVFPVLEARRKQAAGSLSGGEQQMLALSRALAAKPRVLLLDEISMGLAPIIIGELYEIVAHLAEEGLSILLVEQAAKTALALPTVLRSLAWVGSSPLGLLKKIESAALDLYLGSSASAAKTFGA